VRCFRMSDKGFIGHAKRRNSRFTNRPGSRR
jgi:hypothetical protein